MGIEVRNLGFSYSEIPILKNISLNIKDGEFVGIIGPTGSGKTTFTLCLNGLIPNSISGRFSGNILINTKNTKNTKVFDLANDIGLVFQDPDSQIFALTVEDEISFGLENLGLKGKEISERIREVLRVLEIEHLAKKETHELSQGQKQKICIASILAMNPDILVLDEPTSQLDYKGTREVYEILKKLNDSSKTIVVIEHKVDFLLEYADRVLVLNDGKFILDGKPKEVFRNFKTLDKAGIEIPKIFRLEKFLRNRKIRIDLEELLRV